MAIRGLRKQSLPGIPVQPSASVQLSSSRHSTGCEAGGVWAGLGRPNGRAREGQGQAPAHVLLCRRGMPECVSQWGILDYSWFVAYEILRRFCWCWESAVAVEISIGDEWINTFPIFQLHGSCGRLFRPRERLPFQVFGQVPAHPGRPGAQAHPRPREPAHSVSLCKP